MGCSDIFEALAEVEFEVRVVFKDVKSAPVKAASMPLVLTALQITHKRGGKTNHVPAGHGSVCVPRLTACICGVASAADWPKLRSPLLFDLNFPNALS